MAAASYTTDLQSFGANVTTTTGWSEPTGFTNTDGSGEVDTDLSIFGTSCYTEAQRKSGSGGLFYTTTEPADFVDGTDCIFGWFKFFAPNATGTKTSGSGIEMFVGSTSGNFNRYYIAGSDTYAYGGWKNFVVNPNTTAVTPSNTQGSPNGTHNGAGFGATLSYGIAKGNSYNIDIIRYGRGEVIITDGDLGNGYANFDDLATTNDNSTTAQWGLFQDVGGSFLWKGLMTLGVSGTPVDFRHSNRTITIDNTEFVQSDFNKVEINDATSNVEWTGITITSLSTVSRGDFECVDNATVDLTECTFVDMGTFTLQSNTSSTDNVWRRCGLITQGGATITGGTIQNSVSTTAAILSSQSTIGSITDVSFIRTTGTTNAVDLGNLDGTVTSINWDGNQLTGYGTQTAGNNISSTANGAIALNFQTNFTFTINIVNGATTPTVEISGTGTVNIVAAVTVNINGLKDNSEVRVYTAGTTTELNGVESVSGGVGTGINEGTVSGTTDDNTFSFSSSAGANLDIRIFNIDYDSTQILNFTVSANGDNIEAVQVDDRVFSNP